MTRRTNARIAGVTFLFYIAAGLASLALLGHAVSGETIAAKLAQIAQHTTDMGVVIVLALLMSLSALVLGVTLYALTRDQDRDLALLGLICRATEGVIGGNGITSTLALRWLATSSGASAPQTEAAQALGSYLLLDFVPLTGTFFAVGSALFSYLFLRGRMIPAWLAWLGIVASILLVVGLPLQLAGFLHGTIASLMWLPMLAFEVPLAFWLLLKGASMPAPAQER